MKRFQLLYKTSIISYLRFGSGPRTAICFHGYGEEAESFAFLEKHCSEQFTFYSIDLPFHGHTQWKEGLNFTVADLNAIVTAILTANQQQPTSLTKQRITLVGFSLGGRIALSLYQSIPSSIEKIVLLAPDGLKVNFWYWLATQTWLGNKLFLLTMKKPGWFFGFLKLINRLGFVNASIFKFVNYYIGNKEVRQQLYERWTGLRKLKPDLRRVKSLIKTHKTPVRLIYGKHDRIILPVRGEKFISGIEENASISVIRSGHQVLHENHVQEILPALLH